MMELKADNCKLCGTRGKVYHDIYPYRYAFVQCRCGVTGPESRFGTGDKPHIEADELAIMLWNRLQK